MNNLEKERARVIEIAHESPKKKLRNQQPKEITLEACQTLTGLNCIIRCETCKETCDITDYGRS